MKPIALQLYSVRNEMSEDFEGTLGKVKEMGYDGVEFAGLFDHKPEEIKAICDKLDLVPISAHVPYAQMVEDTEGVMSDYAEIGCKFVAIPYLPQSVFTTEEFEGVIEKIKEIGAVANKHGMPLLYHNHDFEFIKLDGKYALDVLYDRVSPNLLQTELDTCWVKVGGEEPSSYIKKYSGRCPVVHLKDYYGEQSEDMYELIGIESKAPKRPSNFEFRPLGEGCQNFATILEVAEQSGAEWFVVEQDNPSMNLSPMESAKKSLEYLKALGY